MCCRCSIQFSLKRQTSVLPCASPSELLASNPISDRQSCVSLNGESSFVMYDDFCATMQAGMLEESVVPYLSHLNATLF